MMRFIGKHILTLGRLLLVLFLVANSGFTIVLYHCTMRDDPDGVSCCSDNNACPAGTCANAGPGPSADAMLARSDVPCMAMTVAGGLQTDPTIVEKESTARLHSKVTMLPVFAPDPALSQNLEEPLFLLSSAASNVSLRSVEKYVLNATFRI